MRTDPISCPPELDRLWRCGVDAVHGDRAVANALAAPGMSPPDAILSIGKAAASMASAAITAYGAAMPVLVVTKYGHGGDLPDTVRVIEAAHPVPDENALVAGAALRDFVLRLAPGAHLLVLVSGGASALAELPEPGLTLADLQADTSRLLAEGFDIHAINTHRKTLSRIKGGRLFEGFRGAAVTTLAISDVAGDDLGVIGSGIGAVPSMPGVAVLPRIVASNAIARDAIATAARATGLDVLSNEECLYQDVAEAAETIARRLLDGPQGLHIFGGEPTVKLPPQPGYGGRNQALALHVARLIEGRGDLAVLVAGTDGTDGPTTAAGGCVTGDTWTEAGAHALARADSGRFLDARGALYSTGPTGTNVMDIALALRR